LVSNVAFFDLFFFDQFFLRGAAGGDVAGVVDTAGAAGGAGGGGGRLIMRSTRCLGPRGPLCCSTVCADSIDAVIPVRATATVKALINICFPVGWLLRSARVSVTKPSTDAPEKFGAASAKIFDPGRF
jgi:hypothetical protein